VAVCCRFEGGVYLNLLVWRFWVNCAAFRVLELVDLDVILLFLNVSE